MLKDKKIGIWGSAVVGTSVFSFLKAQNHNCEIFDYPTSDVEKLNGFDVIIPSPGINAKAIENKILSEVDLFSEFFKKPIIAVTGSLGKTTIVHILNLILKQNGLRSIAAGNIGLPLCDIIPCQEDLDIAVLELSSFQLEWAKKIKPKLAILTNLVPNHLDRHKTFESYKDAKFNLFKLQTSIDKLLAPIDLAPELEILKSDKFYFSISSNFDKSNKVYFLKNSSVFFWDGFSQRLISKIDSKGLNFTFLQNWLIIFAALDLVGQKSTAIDFGKFVPLENRMERFEAHEAIFYNDSKSTVLESTLKAVESLSKEPILFLGGLSKGVDRKNSLKKLKNQASSVICFGKEADQLNAYCQEFGIESKSFINLEDAVGFCLQIVKKGDLVLF